MSKGYLTPEEVADAARPTIGDSVHFRPEASWGHGTPCWAAIAAGVAGPDETVPGGLWLTVFPPGKLPGNLTVPVLEDQNPHHGYTWHRKGSEGCG